jgi:hypothetical protein
VKKNTQNSDVIGKGNRMHLIALRSGDMISSDFSVDELFNLIPLDENPSEYDCIVLDMRDFIAPKNKFSFYATKIDNLNILQPGRLINEDRSVFQNIIGRMRLNFYTSSNYLNLIEEADKKLTKQNYHFPLGPEPVTSGALNAYLYSDLKQIALETTFY